MLPVPDNHTPESLYKLLETTPIREFYASLGKEALDKWRIVSRFLRPGRNCGLNEDIPQDILGVLAHMNMCHKPFTGDPVQDAILGEFNHWTVCWAQMGFPTFQLTDSLQTTLILTDPHKLQVDDAPWPYNSYAVVLPSALQFQDMNGEKLVDARLLIVHRFRIPKEHPDFERSLQQFFKAMQKVQGVPEDELFSGKHSFTVDYDMNDVPSEWKTIVRLVTPKGLSIFQDDYLPLAGSIDTLKDWLECSGRMSLENVVITEKDDITSRIMHRLVANLNFYIASLKDHNRHPKPRKCKRPSGEHAFFELPLMNPEGRVIKLGKELKEAANAFCEQGRNPKSWELQSRVPVRGHPKMQPCGPKNSLRKRILVPPYKRGPESDGIAPRLYEVQEQLKTVCLDIQQP